MATIVERAREVVSAEDDDFFTAETILYYVNQSKNKLVSQALQQELRPTIQTQDGYIPGQEKSLRVLDDLRNIETITVTADQFTLIDDYYKGEVNFPAGMKDKLYLHYHINTPIRELTSQKLHLIEWGNLKPSTVESYYHISNDGTNKLFEIYLPEDAEGNDIKIYYIANPTDIELADETLTDLPERVINAIVYGAAIMMIGQESIKDPEGNPQVILQIYQDEIQNNLY